MENLINSLAANLPYVITGGILIILGGYFFLTVRPRQVRRREKLENEKRVSQEKRLELKKERLKKYSFVIHFRQRDGKKTEFESELIRALRRYGAEIHFVPEADLRKILDADTSPLGENRLAIIGFHWYDDYDGSYHCDWRLVIGGLESRGKFLITGLRTWYGNGKEEQPYFLVDEIINYITDNLDQE